MNTLSLLLYLADFAGKAWIVSFLMGLGFLIYYIFRNILSVDDPLKEISPAHGKWFFIGMTLLALSCFIPSRQTIYLIASSEIGETAINSSYGQRLISRIESTLDQYLENPNE